MQYPTFQLYLNRDGWRCVHCGRQDRLVPNHRMGRGMGGSKALDVPCNVVVMCSWFNGLIEDDHEAASLALAMGWKVGGHPIVTPDVLASLMAQPVYDKASGLWYLLDNDYGRTVRP